MESNKILIIIDAQNDFISGVLGSTEAKIARDNICEFLKEHLNNYTQIFMTRDCHYIDYLETNEGRHLPIEHCKVNTEGWQFDDKIFNLIDKDAVEIITKETFGYFWEFKINPHDFIEIDIMGFCTDICVITNALILKTLCPEAKINVYANCCAGSNVGNHASALDVMRACQIEVI